jgi:hypothetical protein
MASHKLTISKSTDRPFLDQNAVQNFDFIICRYDSFYASSFVDYFNTFFDENFFF